MKLGEVIMVCMCDYAGQVRGKGFPAAELDRRLKGGIGIAPANLMITTFGLIVDNPWGARGELILLPDPKTEVNVTRGEDLPTERFFLGSLFNLDGTPWSCCPRHWLQRGLDVLEGEFGLRVKSAFEHEFHYSGASPRLGDSYSLDAMRLQGSFLQALVHALGENGIVPEMVLPEYGSQQFEVTCRPAVGLAAADHAVCLREITRAVARAYHEKATFAPVMKLGAVGNGVHVHFSIEDTSGAPRTYNPERYPAIGAEAAHFVAGILATMPSFVALTAPSSVSYERLKPHRWSASYNNLADMDREAGVRISPLSKLPGNDPHRSFNLEYRAADSAANPYLVLGALVWAGLDGLRCQLPLPEATDGDPDNLADHEKARRGLRRLPSSLPDALDELERGTRVRSWMGDEFLNAYLIHKRSELKLLVDVPLEEQVRRYAECY